METEEDEMAAAIRLSMGQNEIDPAFMSDVLGSLPGVDSNDPRIKDALKKKKEEDKK